MNTATLIAGRAGHGGGAMPLQCGTQGSPHPDPRAFLKSGSATFTPTDHNIMYLFGHGASGATCSITFANGLGTETSVNVIGLYPVNATSVTWTANGSITVY